MATVKVSKRTYERLNQLAGTLRARLKRPVSVDEVLGIVMKGKELRPSDYFGTIMLSDEEAAAIYKELDVLWSRWNPRKDSS